MSTRTLQLTVAIAALTLGSPQALAVSGSIQAQVPFEFVIGDTVLPPASYIIEVASGTGPSVLTIRTMTTGERVMFDTNQVPEKDDPKMLGLVFDTVGEKTYLTEVWGVTDSGRSVKHLVDGHQLERAPETSRRRIVATRIVDGRENEGDRQ
jgi:hypothetical protein